VFLKNTDFIKRRSLAFVNVGPNSAARIQLFDLFLCHITIAHWTEWCNILYIIYIVYYSLITGLKQRTWNLKRRNDILIINVDFNVNFNDDNPSLVSAI